MAKVMKEKHIFHISKHLSHLKRYRHYSHEVSTLANTDI